MCTLFYGDSGQHFAKTLSEKMVHIPRHFSFLLRVQTSLPTVGARRLEYFLCMFLSSSSLLRNSLNNFRSDTVFFFVLAFSWSSVNDAICSSVNFTNLLLAIFIQGNVWQRLQDAYKFRREITEITSSINSRVRLWKINHSGPGCSFYEFYEWYIFQ